VLDEEYLTVSEAASYLGISRVTVWRRIRDGSLHTYQAAKSKRTKLVKREDLDELLKPQPSETTAYKVRRRKKSRSGGS